MTTSVKWQVLFEPYTKDDCTVEMMQQWLIAEGEKSRLFGPTTVNTVMDELFIALANGRSFLGKCFCGCKSPNIHTHINHWALRRCAEVALDSERIILGLRETQLNAKIEAFARGIPGIERYNDLDDIYEMMDVIYTMMTGQAERDRRTSEQMKYYRKVSVWRKPLIRVWRENIKPKFRRKK